MWHVIKTKLTRNHIFPATKGEKLQNPLNQKGEQPAVFRLCTEGTCQNTCREHILEESTSESASPTYSPRTPARNGDRATRTVTSLRKEAKRVESSLQPSPPPLLTHFSSHNVEERMSLWKIKGQTSGVSIPNGCFSEWTSNIRDLQRAWQGRGCSGPSMSRLSQGARQRRD